VKREKTPGWDPSGCGQSAIGSRNQVRQTQFALPCCLFPSSNLGSLRQDMRGAKLVANTKRKSSVVPPFALGLYSRLVQV
jgi:hypothetical protein